MKKEIVTAVVVLLTGITVLLISSCACSKCGEKQKTHVPTPVKEKADTFIKERTGNSFFNSYIKQDFRRTTKIDNGYLMVYRLVIPEKPFVNTVIEFRTDTSGNVLYPEQASGIPDCLSGGCEFNIDNEQAVEIARNNGLDEGIKDWKTGFMWNSEYKQYVWHVLSTLYESEGSQGYRGNGKEMIIDPASGEVLAVNTWKVN